MARRRAGQDIHAVLLLDKPPGITSNRALQQIRRLLDARKAGHTGSLDPFATGMLPICLGEASKTAAFMLDADKSYRATARLGQTTDTSDPDGQITESCPIPELDNSAIERTLQHFRGLIRQIPPMHSALKVQGKPLYRLARQGIEVDRPARQVTIHQLELDAWNSPDLSFTVHCSKGTYVRTLAVDISHALGTCGHLTALRRVGVGPFRQQDMLTYEEIEQAVSEQRLADCLLPVDAGLVEWPVLRLCAAARKRFMHGNPVPVDAESGMARVHDDAGTVLGIGEVDKDGRLHPRRVFAVV